MKKNTPTLALAALLGLGFTTGAYAQPTVELTGLADMYAGSIRMAGDAKSRSVVDSGGMTTSWWGLKGNEDLGGGLKVGFAFTSFMRMGNGALGRFDGDTPFSRDANIWVGGNFGRLTIGRAMAPNFLPTILFNPFGDSFAFSPLVLHANVPLFNGTNWGATTPADTGWSNQLTYTTPSVGGLQANLHYQFRGDAGPNNRYNAGANVLYFNGPLALTAFYERAQVNNPVATVFADGSTRTDWMLGGSYDFTAAKVFLTYGQARNNVTDARSKTTSVGASVPLGTGKLLAAYAHTQDSGLDKTRRTATIGYDYPLSKRTDLYANLMNDRISGSSSGTSFGVGMRHQF
ncbi:porin [Ottowia sp. VDI28]|uniref:porin n=1 Tax=Ottowia sp. VDI28 TaxID=3133968 RepID=UPI003C2E2595